MNLNAYLDRLARILDASDQTQLAEVDRHVRQAFILPTPKTK